MINPFKKLADLVTTGARALGLTSPAVQQSDEKDEVTVRKILTPEEKIRDKNDNFKKGEEAFLRSIRIYQKDFDSILKAENDEIILFNSKVLISVLKMQAEKSNQGNDTKERKRDRKLAVKQAWEKLHLKQRNEIFDRMNSVGALREFADFIHGEENSRLPRIIKADLQKWAKAQKDAGLKQGSSNKKRTNQELKDLEEIEKNFTPEDADEITIIELDELLPDGENEEIEPASLGAREPKEDTPSHPDYKDAQHRIDWAIELLEDMGFRNSQITIYRKKKNEISDLEKNGYHVFDVNDGDEHFQWAISDVFGKITYIIKDPIDFQTQQGLDITIADLKSIPSVFQVRCYNQKQWNRGLEYYTQTPLENLTEQLKTRIYWNDKKQTVIDSFSAFVLEMDKLPFSNDISIIEHGSLSGQSTWNRVYNALRAKAILGLEDVTSFTELRDHIFGAGTDVKSKREPRKLTKGTKEIAFYNASDVFAFAALDIAECGSTPIIDPAFESALQAGKVTGLAKLVKNPDEIKTTEDFLIATGLATRHPKKGNLVTISRTKAAELAATFE